MTDGATDARRRRMVDVMLWVLACFVIGWAYLRSIGE